MSIRSHTFKAREASTRIQLLKRHSCPFPGMEHKTRKWALHHHLSCSNTTCRYHLQCSQTIERKMQRFKKKKVHRLWPESFLFKSRKDRCRLPSTRYKKLASRHFTKISKDQTQLSFTPTHLLPRRMSSFWVSSHTDTGLSVRQIHLFYVFLGGGLGRGRWC